MADRAYEACMGGFPPHHVEKCPKSGHLERMVESGCFRYTKEIVVHHTEEELELIGCGRSAARFWGNNRDVGIGARA